MQKRLEEMTLKELWQMFPIVLKPYNQQYACWYREMAEKLKAIFDGTDDVRIYHIGSTAIPGLLAKPIVDILMEFMPGRNLGWIKERLNAAGWFCTLESSKRLSFNWGYTPDGFAECVYHLHVRYWGDHDALYFRDYLLAHPDTARKYGELKQKLAGPYKHDRDGYTRRKTDFVDKYTQEGKREFAGRYEDK